MAECSDTPSFQFHLSQFLDWSYLLREFYQLYRFSSAGGSSQIRTHQKEVRHRLSRLINQEPAMRQPQSSEIPACRHFSRAIDRGLTHSTAPLLRAIERIRGQLYWEYGYPKVPPGLKNKFAFSVITGPEGPILSKELILGLVLFAPGTTYPTHKHQGITESYFCLSGSISENDVGVYVPGSLILNPPEHRHRITTSAQDPSLLAYAWVGAPEKLAEQKLTFSRPNPK